MRRIRVVVLVAAAALAALAWIGPPPLQPPADLATRGYAPRPDWYFLGLAEFASRIAAPYRVAAVLTLTGILGGCLALLPWLDRARTREPGSRLRVLAPWSAALLAAVLLTGWGLRHAPRVDPAAWSFQAIAGASLIQTSDRCVRCHRPAGVAEPIEAGHITRPQDWLAMHVGDPEVLTAGIREAPFVNQADSRAMVAALAHLRSGPPPAVDAGTLRVYALFSRYCVDCHQLNGTGGVTGPDLSHTGLKFGAATLEQRIAAAHDIRPDTVMPSFSGIIDPSDIQALAAWLAQQK